MPSMLRLEWLEWLRLLRLLRLLQETRQFLWPRRDKTTRQPNRFRREAETKDCANRKTYVVDSSAKVVGDSDDHEYEKDHTHRPHSRGGLVAHSDHGHRLKLWASYRRFHWHCRHLCLAMRRSVCLFS